MLAVTDASKQMLEALVRGQHDVVARNAEGIRDSFDLTAGALARCLNSPAKTRPPRHRGSFPIPMAASVLVMETFASLSACVKARIASMVSGTTIAWLSTM